MITLSVLLFSFGISFVILSERSCVEIFEIIEPYIHICLFCFVIGFVIVLVVVIPLLPLLVPQRRLPMSKEFLCMM